MAYRYPNLAVAGACGRWFRVVGFTLVVMAAQNVGAQEHVAQNLLRDACIALDSHQWVSAKLHQQIDLYQQQLIGNGFYRQGPPGSDLMHFDLKLRLVTPADVEEGGRLQGTGDSRQKDEFNLGNQSWVFQERCDGNFYWRCQGVSKQRMDVARVDIGRLREALDDAQASDGNVPRLGLGGLPKLLRAIDKSFDFNSFKYGKLGRRSVYALHGQWRPEKLSNWLPEQREAILAGRPVDLRKLPAPLPDHVFVLLGRDDMFVYRIEYRREDSKAPGSSRILLAMNLDDPVFAEPIEAHEFSFEPGGLPVVDQTEMYLQRLGLSRESP